DGQAVGTINNDDPLPALLINDVAVSEGNAGTTNALFTVRLSTASGQPVTVDFATLDGSALAGSDYFSTNGTLTFAPGMTNPTISGQTVTVNYATANGTAIAGTDYVQTNGTLSFAPGTTTQTISVRVNGDMVNEADETFFVNLSSPLNALLSDNQGMGTINNDD